MCLPWGVLLLPITAAFSPTLCPLPAMRSTPGGIASLFTGRHSSAKFYTPPRGFAVRMQTQPGPGAQKKDTEEGSVIGASLLFAGTAIGAGMLALPAETAAAGFFPSEACVPVFCL